MTVVVAVIAAARKDYSLDECITAIGNLTYADKLVYLNYQRDSANEWYKPAAYEEVDATDAWHWESSWHADPAFDQDRARLEPIVMARNMAINFAVAKNADHLLFVDSDVIVPPDSIEKLLEIDAPLCSGMVPGRGAHSHVHYVFGQRASTTIGGVPVVRCNHGTMGFCMIRRSVFKYIRFRTGYFNGYWWSRGLSNSTANEIGSEDPLFAEDAEAAQYTKGWMIRGDLFAQHLDNPSKPLTLAEAVNDYDEP